MDPRDKLDRLVREIRSLTKTDDEAVFPVSFSDGVNHQPVDPMHFKIGQWTDTPWPAVKCLGLYLTQHQVKVLCQVTRPIRLDKQEHGPWAERLIMDVGELYEHSTGITYKPGEGEYYQPAGVIHEPEFKTPAICLITWTRTGKE